MGAANNMLELRNLEVNYGNIRALKGISLVVNKGEIVAIIGANGAGKTTTLMTICGILSPRTGEIVFEKKEIHKLGCDRIVELGISQAPEGRRIYPKLSVFDNLRLGAVATRDKSNLADTIADVYNLFPRLQERRKQMAGTLSGGEQQMLAIGRALMSRPRLLLLDEPSLGIAPMLADQIFVTLEKINKAGMTILLVEQNAQASLYLSNRAYVFQTGRVIMSGSSKELRVNEDIKKAYLGG